MDTFPDRLLFTLLLLLKYWNVIKYSMTNFRTSRRRFFHQSQWTLDLPQTIASRNKSSETIKRRIEWEAVWLSKSTRCCLLRQATPIRSEPIKLGGNMLKNVISSNHFYGVTGFVLWRATTKAKENKKSAVKQFCFRLICLLFAHSTPTFVSAEKCQV